MRLWSILRSRFRSLLFRDRREADLREELQFHLDQEAARLRAAGVPPEEARRRAQQTFGGVEPIKEQCRDARGTGAVHDLARDLHYAARGLRRAPLVALTIVTTVAVGLGLVVVAFTFLNRFLFDVDAVPGVHEMFAVQRPEAAGTRASFTRAEFDRLVRETDVFSAAYAQIPRLDTRVAGRRRVASLVSGNFFQVVRVGAAMGRTLTTADDAPSAPRPVAVLSHRGWRRLFANDPAVLERALVVGGVTFGIVGVMPDQFRGLQVVPPDFWAPLSAAGTIRPGSRGDDPDLGVEIIGRLRPDRSAESAAAALSGWVASTNGDITPRRVPDVTLVPRRGTVPQPLEALLLTAPLFFAFGLILLIAYANVTNLLLARAVARQREIGIRLSLGAGRGRIIRQLLTESLLLALLSATAGFVISRLALSTLVYLLMANWPPEIGDLQLVAPAADWRVGLFVLVGALVSTVSFGLLPALQATRLDPITTMRGEMIRHLRPGRARSVLVGIQVGVSALLLICAAVFLRSALAAAVVDPGLRTTDTILVGVRDEATRAAMVRALADAPSVRAVAAAWPGPLSAAPGTASNGSTTTPVGYRRVSAEYFEVLDIAILRGRAFSRSEQSEAVALAIVSESAALALWPGREAIGRVLRIEPRTGPEQGAGVAAFPSRTATVIGIAKDVAGFRIAPVPKAAIYLPGSLSMVEAGLVARVNGDVDQQRQVLLDRLAAIDPGIEEMNTLRWMSRVETYLLGLGFWATVGLGVLAMALTLSGLYSVLSYLVEQRTREIGVRMALGATTKNVALWVIGQSIRPVGVGLLVGAGAVAILARLLLATAGAATIGEIVHVLDPVAYGAGLVIVLVGCLLAASIPALRAARLDPTVTLRQQ
jgi:predicted permease